MNLHTHQPLLRMVKLLLVVSVVFAGLFMATAKPAEAVSWWHTAELCNDYDGNVRCDTYSLYTATVNTNKTTYAPGETINLSASTVNPQCNNFTISYYLTTTVDGVTAGLGSGAYNGGQTRYHSNTRVAPMTPGSHNITATYCANWVGWQCTSRTIPITVVAPPAVTATVSGTGCQIAKDQSSCVGTASWNITNATAPDLYQFNSSYGNSVYANAASGSGVPITLFYEQNTLTARNTGIPLASTELTASCSSGLVYDGDRCVMPSATLSASGCTITTQGDDTCVGSATWNITNASSPNIYSNNGTTYSINPSGTNQSINIPYGVSTLYARDGGLSLADTVVSVSCGSGLDWNGSQCDVPPPPPIPPAQIQLNVDRELIRSGDTVEVTSRITASYPVSCTLSGVASSPITFMNDLGVNQSVHTYTSRPLTSAQIISLSCVADPAIVGVGQVTAEERISVVPVIQEI